VSDEPVDEMPRDVATALRFLNDLAAGRPDTCMFLPGMHRVQALNRGRRGWVRLAFYGCSKATAEELVSQLLVAGPDVVEPLDADWAFEGVPAAPDEGGAGAMAKLRPGTPPPSAGALPTDEH
jgi:hypothetical protein